MPRAVRRKLVTGHRADEPLARNGVRPGELAQPVLAVDAAEPGVADPAEGKRTGCPANEITALTATIPHRSRAAISAPRALEKTVAPSP